MKTDSILNIDFARRYTIPNRDLVRAEAERRAKAPAPRTIAIDTFSNRLDLRGERVGDWWDKLPPLDNKPYFPIASYLHGKTLPTCYRINLKPRFVYIAQKKAEDQGINFEAVLQSACYQAMKNLGVEFDSQAEMEALTWEIEKPQCDPMHHYLKLAQVYVDVEDLPLTPRKDTNVIPAREIELVEPPQIKLLNQELERTAKAIVRLRNLRKYDSIYAENRPTFQQAVDELNILIDLYPAFVNELPVAMWSLQHQLELLRKYEGICRAELDLHLKLAQEPMPSGMRAAVLTRAKEEADYDRKLALKMHYFKGKRLTREPIAWAGELTSEQRAALLFESNCKPVDAEPRPPCEGMPALDLALTPIRARLIYTDPRIERDLRAENRAVDEQPRYFKRRGKSYLDQKRHIRDMKKNTCYRMNAYSDYINGILAIHFEWKYKSPAPYITRAKMHTDPYGASYVEES